MRGAALLGSVLVAAACSAPAPDREASASRHEAFTSVNAVLVQFELDARVTTASNDAATLDRLVHAQLMFSIGQLNAVSSVGRVDASSHTITNVTALSTKPPTYAVDYHAILPVAWGGGRVPTSYALKLPKRVDHDDQVAFAAKYGGRCTDEEGGAVDAGDLFYFYRPNQAGCVIDDADAIVVNAKVTTAPGNTTGKYPEYHRVWDDAELDYVAIFGREFDDGRTEDDGARAYAQFVQRTRDALKALQPDDAQRAEQSDSSLGEPSARLSATLVDGRRVRVDVLSARPSLRADAALEGWYDARSADADVIFYSGHAGLGENIHALMGLGVFRSGKYVIAAFNGCDTFAYVDDTLAARRALLNPGDPGGTRYMDTITNVLGAYFHSGDGTAAELFDALVSAATGSPKTYRQIFDAVDPTQMIVVDGEQDNEFAPGMIPPPPQSPPPSPKPSVTTTTPEAPATPSSSSQEASQSTSGCSIQAAGSRGVVRASWLMLAAAVAAFAARRSCRRRAPSREERGRGPFTRHRRYFVG